MPSPRRPTYTAIRWWTYRIQHAYFVDKNDKSYKAPWNQIKNIPEVYTPADTAIQTPNSDTPYSFVGLDLRAGPIVITVPAIEKERYYSIQFIDAYTFNFAYVGSRSTCRLDQAADRG